MPPVFRAVPQAKIRYELLSHLVACPRIHCISSAGVIQSSISRQLLLSGLGSALMPKMKRVPRTSQNSISNYESIDEHPRS